MNDVATTEAFEMIRSLIDDRDAQILVSKLEIRLDLAEAMVRVYERYFKLSAPGEGLGEPSAITFGDGSPVAATTGAGADIIELHRYSWKVDGGAA